MTKNIQTSMPTRTRRYDLDIIKIIAMFLVMWGHFIGTGTYAFEIPGIINGKMALPILHECKLIKIDNFLYSNFHIQTAVLGVVLFFFISGYFIPHMQQKYNNNGFPLLWFKQAWKIIPTLSFCVFINGILVWKTQGITYTLKDYIATSIYGGGYICKGVSITMGVTWYLAVLSFVYFLGSVAKHFTLRNICMLYFCLFVMVLSSKVSQGSDINWLFSKITYLAAFTGIPLLGVAYSLLKEKQWLLPYKILTMFFFVILTIFLNGTYNNLYDPNTSLTYAEKNTYIVVLLIIILVELACYALRHLKNYTHLKNTAKKIVTFLSRLFLPVYLVHVHWGMLTMFYMRQHGIRYRYCILSAVIVSFFVAFVSSKIISLFYRTVEELKNLVKKNINQIA